MRKLIGLAIFAVSTAASGAPMLTWDIVSGSDGYRVYCANTPVVDRPAPIATTGPSLDIVDTVTLGVEAECWVTAVAGGFESIDSDHIVFVPRVVETIRLPSAPSGITITW